MRPRSPYVIHIFLLLTAWGVPLVHALSTPASVDSLQSRQHDHDHASHDMDMDMAGGDSMDMPEVADPSVDASGNPSTSSSSSSTAAIHDSAVHSQPSGEDPAGHHHGSHTAPKVVLDDESIHQWHHYPPSYLAADFRLDNDSAIFGEEFDEAWDPAEAGGKRGLMVLHVVGMSLAYFAALPIALGLRAAHHPSHYIANAVFLVIAAFGWLTGVAYKAATPDRYQGSVHGGFGNVLVLLSISLAFLDSLGLIQRGIAYYRSGQRDWSTFFSQVLRSGDHKEIGSRYEMIGLTTAGQHDDEDEHTQDVVFEIGDEDEEEEDDEIPHQPSARKPQLSSLLFRQSLPPSRVSTGSSASDGTLHDTPTSASPTRHSYEHHKPSSHRRGAYDAEHPARDMHHEEDPVWEQVQGDKMTAVRFGEILLTWVRRTQIVLAYVVTLTGITIYLGMCRGGLINTCAAHFIKGSIFFGYGLLTFARYLGAYAELGWAWNRRPDGKQVASAEMIECFVIFLYGITNTWMERFGAHAGDPYTVKQVQHISIAVMFWFAGLMGMFLESRRVRRLLGAVMSGGKGKLAEPSTYAFSFNPLPAIVIAVTGLAMAAHHQDYVFQVEIHSLWGILLAGGSAFRLLTYFFLYLRPPVDSTLPGRPPTELLTSFGYASGGIVFILSSEEVTWAAMRAGYDDMMAFLNFTIALTSLTFCWIVFVMGVKGWAYLRLHRERSGGVRV